MRRWIHSLLVLFPSLLLPALLMPTTARAQSEEILNYVTEISVRPDGILDVSETITVRALGKQIKRGIYRDFPTHYRTRVGRNVVVDFDVVSVKRDGRSEPYRVTGHENGVRVYVGDKDVYLKSGVYTYQLNFRTSRQLGFFNSFDELYFNAIGHGWVFPIAEASVIVNLPQGIPESKVFLSRYRGRQGSVDQSGIRERPLGNGSYEFAITRPLGRYEGLTISVQWPKGFVQPPSFLQKLLWFIADNSVTLVCILGSFALIGYYCWMWNLYGRDPAKGVIIPEYEAPDGVTPWGMRYLIRMKFDAKCLACALTSMAIKGHIRIHEVGKKFRVESAEYSEKKEALNDTEQVLLGILFRKGSSFVFDKEDHSTVQSLLSTVESSAKARHLDTNLKLNRGRFFLGIVILVLMLIAMAITSAIAFQPMFSIMSGALVAICVVVIALFETLMKAPTIAGRKLMDRIEGYKMYLNTAEGDRLKRANFDNFTSEVFEHHLPYAMALDVEDNWAKFFMAALAAAGQDPSSYQPSYFYGSRNWYSSGSAFNSMSSGISSAIASSSVPPGSSSGGGGGGFSGGGGGGGGGGGW